MGSPLCSRALLAALAITALGVFGVGCAHTVTIQTEPQDANVVVDGEELGRAPVQVEKVVYVGDTLRVRAEREGYAATSVSIPASELFLWPGLLAVVPLLGIPMSVPALLFPVLGPFIAAAFATSWAIVTSPLILSLALTRKYPDTVTITLPKRQRSPSDALVPDDDDPNDLGANPLPDVGVPRPGTARPPTPAPRPRPPDGANPPPS